MGTRDVRVDAYIAKSADFARPILKQHCAFGFWKGMAEGKSRHWKYVRG